MMRLDNQGLGPASASPCSSTSMVSTHSLQLDVIVITMLSRVSPEKLLFVK